MQTTTANQHATEQELASWIEQEDRAYAAKEAERKQREREFLRSFNFEHAKFELKRSVYARAINA